MRPSLGAVEYPALNGEMYERAPDQSNAKGHDTAGRLFAIGGAEVNAFNFYMMIGFSEGIGFSLPVDGGLQITLARHYNSNMVAEKSWQCEYPCRMPPPQPPGRVIKYLSLERQYPLGFGWEFHLGRIYQKAKVIEGSLTCFDVYENPAKVRNGFWAYLAPDGSEHLLVYSSSESTPDIEVYYSKDGSMLKAERSADGSWVLYAPDGIVTEFGHHVGGSGPRRATPGTHRRPISSRGSRMPRVRSSTFPPAPS